MLKKLRLFGTLLLVFQIIAIIAVVSTVMILSHESFDPDGLRDDPSYSTDADSIDLLYEVWVNGEMLCVTDDPNDYFIASDTVEKVMSGKLGYSHSLADDLSVELVAIRTTKASDSIEKIYSSLMSETEALYDDCYALYLGGNVVGYCPLSEKENLEAIVSDIIGYVSENHSNHNEKSIVYAALGYTKTENIVSSVSDMSDALSIAGNGSHIESEFDDTVISLITSIDNAILFGNNNTIPDNVSPTVTVISERVRRTETESIAFGKLRAPDVEYGLLYGDDDADFVYIKGKNGQCTVEYEDVYVNGVYSHTVRIEESLTVTVAPVDEVTIYGTQSTEASFDFIWPTVGWVTSEYGYRKAEIAGMSTYHKGIDIARSGNPKIVAADAGQVVHVEYSSSYGWNVIIYHGNGIATRYAHMCKRPEVSVGDRVYKGETLGYMGRTGNVTGAHLHFEVYVGFESVGKPGNRENPRKYLPSGSPAVQW